MQSSGPEEVTIDAINQRLRAHGQGEIQDYHQNQWWRTRISIRELRSLHHEFRDLPVAKGRLMWQIEREWRTSIVEGTIALPEDVISDIRRGFNWDLEIVVVRDGKRDLYVLDGCKRVIAACHHGSPESVLGFVVDTDENREVFEETGSSKELE